MQATILIVDDEGSMRLTLSMLLKREGYRVVEAEGGEDAVRRLEREIFDMVITDLKMEGRDGLEVLKTAKRFNPDSEVVILTAYGTVESAVEAMKHGAFDYITKPIEPERVPIIVAKALERKRLMNKVRHLEAQVGERFSFENIIGKSEAIQKVLEMVERVSRTDTTILIEGESGTGKELIAKAIHTNSLRKDMPFIALNCGALPETLLESELFGYTRGAFTGATTNRKGLFEEADKGTLFLDEIGVTTPSTQVKLLRVLQEGEIKRLGSATPVKTDVRIVAATNRNLKDMVEKGVFREDLYYRLNVISIILPPLRDRREDIPLLVDHFIRVYSSRTGKVIKGISPEVIDLFYNYHWPGNVRELENAIERAVILARDDVIGLNDLPPLLSGLKPMSPIDSFMDSVMGKHTPSGVMKGGMTLKEMERIFILSKLHEHSWNQAKVAKELGIGRNTLWRKLKEYGIKTQEDSGEAKVRLHGQ